MEHFGKRSVRFGKHVFVHFIKFNLKVHRADFIFNLPLTGTAINFLWAHKKLLSDGRSFFLSYGYKTERGGIKVHV